VALFIDASKRDWRIIGVSFRFLSIDFAGAVFSLLSLCFQDMIDRYAAGSYITVMVLEIGICIIQCSWIVRKWGTIREARREGKTFDEFMGGKEVLGKKEKAEVVSTVGPRDWRVVLSLSGMFVAINRRHGEDKSADGVENGANAFMREKVESQVTNTTTGENLESQELCFPSSTYAPGHPPRRGSKSEPDSQAPNSD
jgi:hypothetical protein